MEYKDYYKVLGLDRKASQDEIKRAYRKLARKYHPDVSKEAGAEDKFKELNEAYEVLKEPANRAKYDQYGEHWNQQGQQGAYQHQQRQHPQHSGAGQAQHGFSGESAADFEDLLSSIFGQHRRQQHHAPAYDEGQDIYAKINITLEDSYHGAEKTLQLQIPENNTEQLKTIKVKIPKGIGDKKQIRLKGQGGSIGGRPRDLYIEIHINPHPWFRLEDKDIYLQLPIAPWEAGLGATINVPTLGGPVKLNIPKGSQAGKKMRLKGRGLPGNPAGDQLVTLQIVIPEKENEQATKLYQEMAKVLAFNPRAHLGVRDDA